MLQCVLEHAKTQGLMKDTRQTKEERFTLDAEDWVDTAEDTKNQGQTIEGKNGEVNLRCRRKENLAPGDSFEDTVEWFDKGSDKDYPSE